MEMSTDAHVVQIFALDSLDWQYKTLEGGSFHATNSISIENTVSANGTQLPDIHESHILNKSLEKITV